MVKFNEIKERYPYAYQLVDTWDASRFSNYEHNRIPLCKQYKVHHFRLFDFFDSLGMQLTIGHNGVQFYWCYQGKSHFGFDKREDAETLGFLYLFSQLEHERKDT